MPEGAFCLEGDGGKEVEGAKPGERERRDGTDGEEEDALT